MLELAHGDVRLKLMDPCPHEDDGDFYECTMFVRSKRFFHLHRTVPDGRRVFVMGAYATSSSSPSDMKSDFLICTDDAYLVADPAPFFAQLKCISSRGSTFAIFDGTDDPYAPLLRRLLPCPCLLSSPPPLPVPPLLAS